MVEVTINKLKNKFKDSLLDFLFKRTKDVSFSAFHVYKVNPEIIDDLISEYKDKCQSRLKETRELYRKNPDFFAKGLKKLHITDDEGFEEFTLETYQQEVSVAIQMKANLDNLAKRDDDIDYKELFPSIANSLKEIEIHMFDSLNSNVIPFDYVIYSLTDEIKEFFKNVKHLGDIFYSPVNDFYAMFNPLFCNENEGFAIISTDTNQISMQLSNEDYEEFKKLKIKHDAEFIEDEK